MADYCTNIEKPFNIVPIPKNLEWPEKGNEYTFKEKINCDCSAQEFWINSFGNKIEQYAHNSSKHNIQGVGLFCECIEAINSCQKRKKGESVDGFTHESIEIALPPTIFFSTICKIVETIGLRQFPTTCEYIQYSSAEHQQMQFHLDFKSDFWNKRIQVMGTVGVVSFPKGLSQTVNIAINSNLGIEDGVSAALTGMVFNSSIQEYFAEIMSEKFNLSFLCFPKFKKFISNVKID